MQSEFDRTFHYALAIIVLEMNHGCEFINECANLTQSQVQEGEDCPICFDPLSNKENIKLPCGHMYHYPCYLESAMEHNYINCITIGCNKKLPLPPPPGLAKPFVPQRPLTIPAPTVHVTEHEMYPEFGYQQEAVQAYDRYQMGQDQGQYVATGEESWSDQYRKHWEECDAEKRRQEKEKEKEKPAYPPMLTIEEQVRIFQEEQIREFQEEHQQKKSYNKPLPPLPLPLPGSGSGPQNSRHRSLAVLKDPHERVIGPAAHYSDVHLEEPVPIEMSTQTATSRFNDYGTDSDSDFDWRTFYSNPNPNPSPDEPHTLERWEKMPDEWETWLPEDDDYQAYQSSLR